MSLKNWWSTVAAKATENNAYFQIATDRVVDTHTPGSTDTFVPGQTYFEIRLKQMFLKNRREWAREFLPLASVNAEFQFDGKRVSAPMVLGPGSLAQVEKVAKGDSIEFLNTRVVGPCPYEGEDLEVFFGLFRMVTHDWSKRTLSLLEDVFKTFDSSRLSSFLNIGKPLADGIEGFIGMKDLEMRLGQHVQYAAPVTGKPVATGGLRPSFEVSLVLPRSKISPVEQRRFWVKEGRLFYGETEHQLTEFTEADFILFHIAPLEVRHDYTSFDFHKRHWKRIEELLAVGKNDDAFETFKLLAADIVQCADIIHPHRVALLLKYRTQMDEAVKFYKRLFSRTDTLEGTAMRGASQGFRPLDEFELLGAVERGAIGSNIGSSPEQLMRRFTN